MLKETVLNIGFDDTDSPKGMCTTFLAYKIVDLLQKQKTEFLDFPRLIRFNPNIPCGSFYLNVAGFLYSICLNIISSSITIYSAWIRTFLI